MRTVPPPLVLLLLVPCLATAASAGFTCKGNTTTCRSLVGFQPANATTYGGVASLFNVTLPSLLAANNLSPATPSSGAVVAGSTLRIAIPCRCYNATGRSDRTPEYTVQDGDGGLYNITVARFGLLTTYREIGIVNNLADVNKILVGQKLWIPLPCSCDEVGGAEVMHLAHRVAAGSSVASIAAEFGTSSDTLLQLNGMNDPKALQTDQILDVPLRVCSSSIDKKSEDYGLRFVGDSYAITAGGCVTCNCRAAASYELECFESKVAQGGTTRCSMGTCGANLFIGNTTTSSSSSCEVNKCSYAGYTNSSNLITVLAANTTTSNCTSSSGSSGEFGLRSGFKWSALLLLFLHMISVSF